MDCTGLAFFTIRQGLIQLETTGWYSPGSGIIDCSAAKNNRRRVAIPAGLIAERRVRAQAKLLYGILQTLPDKSKAFTYPTLAALAGISIVTVRQSVRELAETGWIQASQPNRLAPIGFALHNPDLAPAATETALAKQRLKEANYRGEAIMREYLSLLIDSNEFEDNARPGFLRNPLTDDLLELDRYYPAGAGFEFNGPQHYRTTNRFPNSRKLSTRQARDLIKEALCARKGIQFVVIQPADLRLVTMQQKVGTHLPRRDLRGYDELIALLEKAGRSYRG